MLVGLHWTAVTALFLQSVAPEDFDPGLGGGRRKRAGAWYSGDWATNNRRGVTLVALSVLVALLGCQWFLMQ